MILRKPEHTSKTGKKKVTSKISETLKLSDSIATRPKKATAIARETEITWIRSKYYRNIDRYATDNIYLFIQTTNSLHGWHLCNIHFAMDIKPSVTKTKHTAPKSKHGSSLDVFHWKQLWLKSFTSMIGMNERFDVRHQAMAGIRNRSTHTHSLFAFWVFAFKVEIGICCCRRIHIMMRSPCVFAWFFFSCFFM